MITKHYMAIITMLTIVLSSLTIYNFAVLDNYTLSHAQKIIEELESKLEELEDFIVSGFDN